jgi:hypothetical protein
MTALPPVRERVLPGKLALYDHACAALAKAVAVDEVKDCLTPWGPR